jgi:translation initiation factor 2A
MSGEPENLLLVRVKNSVVITTPGGEAVGGFSIEGDCTDCDVAFFEDKLMAVANSTHVRVVSLNGYRVVATLDAPRVQGIAFSPKGTFVVTFAPPDTKNSEPNMSVWGVHDGNVALRCVQVAWPALAWSADERYCVRKALGCIFVHDGNLKSDGTGNLAALQKLDLQLPRTKEAVISVCPSGAPLLATFVPWNKSNKGRLSLTKLPALADAVGKVDLDKADDAKIQWNSKGTALTAVIKTELDATGSSYYGTAKLYVMNASGEAKAIVLPKDAEGIHDVKWSPIGDEFIVVHGAMPRNKATLFSISGEPIYTFGEAPRNVVAWSPDGKFFVMGGIGNLAGEFQFYDRSKVGSKGQLNADGKLGYFVEKCSTFQWSPCSRYLICSTVFTRLRLNNKYIVFKHNGQKLESKTFPELFESTWVPKDKSLFKPRPASPVAATETATAKPQAWKPRNASTAAQALLARPAPSSGGAVKPVKTGPVGACAVVEKKKKNRKKGSGPAAEGEEEQ